MWAAIASADNSLVNRYGGQVYRDNFYVSVNERMENARDNAFNLRYTNDMVLIKQVIDYRDFATYLYSKDNFGNSIAASYGSDIRWAVHHPKKRMYTYHYANRETAAAQLRADHEAMWAKVGTPKVSYEVRLAALKNVPGYEDFMVLQDCRYGDRGRIYCPELGIDTEQEIAEVEKDELTGEIISMRLGNLASSIIRPNFLGSTVSNGRTAEDKAAAAMQEGIRDNELRSIRDWGDASAFRWSEINKYTWEEVERYGR